MIPQFHPISMLTFIPFSLYETLSFLLPLSVFRLVHVYFLPQCFPPLPVPAGY